MTKRDFFRIVIKIFGLYSVITTLFCFFPLCIQYGFFEINIFQIIILLFALGVTLLLLYVLINKTDWIINFFKLDKGFDEDDIKMGQFNTYNITSLAILLIGGYLIVTYFSDFIFYSLLSFREEVRPGLQNSFDFFKFGGQVDHVQWIISGVNILVGYLLITNFKRIAIWLNKIQSTTND